MNKAFFLLLACVFVYNQRTYAKPPQFHQESDSCGRYKAQPIIRYHIARKVRIKESRLVYLFISIDPEDVDRSKLLTLGCALGRKFSREWALAVYIFDNNKFAKSFNPQGEGNSDAAYRSNCGLYRFIREGQVTGQEMLLRSNPKSSDLDIRIDLGPPPT